MPNYRCSFDRIGRNNQVESLTTTADDADDLAGKIITYARTRLASRDIDVTVDIARGTGTVYAGIQVAGYVAIDQVPA